MPKITIRDTELYYETHGQGEPLLLIHGLGSSSRDWELQLTPFSERYRVISYDVRGHGQSAKPPGPYSVPQFAGDAIGLLDALEVESAHVLGISMGGMIVFQLAVSYPERVKSAIVVNSGPSLVLRSFGQRLQGLTRFLVARFMGMQKMGEMLSKRIFIKPEQEELRQLFVERWAQNDKQAYLASMRGLVGWSVEDKIGEIACPVLVVAGDDDYTPISHKEAYVAKMPTAKLCVIADSRHATTVEHPDEFNTAVLDFLPKHKLDTD